jgi:hypothetical protein
MGSITMRTVLAEVAFLRAERDNAEKCLVDERARIAALEVDRSRTYRDCADRDERIAALEAERDEAVATVKVLLGDNTLMGKMNDRCAALEAKNAALREVERIARASVGWIATPNLQQALRDAIATLNALHKEKP